MDKNDVNKLENKNKDKKISKSASPNSKNVKKENKSNKSIIRKEQKIKVKNNKINNKNIDKNKKNIEKEQNVSKNITSSFEVSSKNTTLNKINDITSKEDKKTNFSEPKKNKKKNKIENKIILNDIDSDILKNINNLPNYSNRSFDISTIRNLNSTSLNNSLNKSISKVIKTNTSIIEDQKYRNTLTDIYNKRKKRFSPENNNKEKNDKNITYERSINYIKRKQDKLKQLKTEFDNKEIEDCTFKPIIIKNKYNNKLNNRSNTTNNKKKYNEFYQRNIEWKNVIKKNQNQLIDKSNEEMKECTFYPKTTKEVHNKVLTELKYETEPNFIYKKNIEWLNRVKENRKKSEKELINQIKSEQDELKKNSKKMYEKIMGKKMEINKNNLNIINDNNKKENKEINFDEINNMIKEFKNIIENNKKFMKENQFNFKNYEKDSTKKKNKVKNNNEGFSKYQNDINNKIYENLIKPKKWVYKKESEEEMNNKYNLLMEKYKKEKNN